MRQNLGRFLQLCGNDTLIFGTTKWGEVTREVDIEREKKLLAETKWTEKLGQHPEIVRFINTPKSAKAIVDLIVRRNKAKALPETDTDKTLRILDELLKARQDMRQRLDEGQRLGPRDEERYEMQIFAILKQFEELNLKIPLSRRLWDFLVRWVAQLY